MNYNCILCGTVIRMALKDEHYSLSLYNMNNPKRKSRIKHIKTYYICKSCYKLYIKDKMFIKKEPM